MSEQLSKQAFDEFKERILDSQNNQYALSQSTNEQLKTMSLAVNTLQGQMTQVLEHVAAQKQQKRELRVARLTGIFSLTATLIIGAVELLKHLFSKG